MSKRISVELLTDNPATTDEFSGRPHERIASAIAELIIKNPGGRAIGLDGGWGAGKSTVIELIKTVLENHRGEDGKRYVVLPFDAWAHQEDPIRSVFLEELVEKMANLPTRSTSKWQEMLAKLKHKTKKTTEDIRDRLSWVSVAAIITLPFYPIGFAVLADPQKYGISKLVPLEWIPWVVLAILFSPHVFAFITWLSWRASWLPKSAYYRDIFEWVSTPRKEYVGKSVFRLWSKDTEHRVVEQTIFEAEANSNDFNKVFDELLVEAANAKYNFVIVLDNLDRLPHDLIRAVWATMRNFFAASPGSSRASILQNVWLIVPFDRDQIADVFADGSDKDRQTRGFIDKTFFVTLRVAPPLLSAYREYFHAKLNDVFGAQLTGDEKESVFQLFDIHVSASGAQLTPRTIKTFINAFAMQVQQWGRTIPILHHALYIIYQDKLRASPDALQAEDFLHNRVRDYLGNTDWQRYLAAAHFNVSPSDAYQMLLGPNILAALTSGNSEDLNKLSSNPGFAPTLHSVVLDAALSTARNEPNTFIEVVCAISETEIRDEPIRRQIWQRLEQANRALGQVTVATKRVAKAMAELVANAVDQPEAAQKILSTLRTLKLPQESVAVGSDWVAIVDAVRSKAVTLENPRVMEAFEKISMPTANPHFLIGVAASLPTPSGIVLDHINVEGIPKITETFVSSYQDPNGPAKTLIAALSTLRSKPDLVDESALVAAVTTRLSNNQPPLDATHVVRSLEILMFAAGHPVSAVSVAAGDALKTLFDTGAFHGLVAKSTDQHKILPVMIACFLEVEKFKFVSSQANHPIYGDLAPANTLFNGILDGSAPLSNEGREILLSRINEWKLLPDLIKAAISEPSEFFKHILREAIRTNSFNDLVVSQVVQEFDKISGILGEDLSQSFLRRFDGWNSHLHEAITGDRIQKVSDKFLTLSHQCATENGKTLFAAVFQHLSSLDQQKWTAAITKEDDNLRLLVNFSRLGKYMTLGADFREAVHAHAFGLKGDASIPKKYSVSDWHILPLNLSSENLDILFDNLRDNLLASTVDPSRGRVTLKLYGPGLMKTGRLERDADRAVRHLIMPLVLSMQDDVAELFRANSSVLKAVFSAAPKVVQSSVKQNLEELHMKHPGKADWLHSVAEAIGATIEVPSSSNDEHDGDAKGAGIKEAT